MSYLIQVGDICMSEKRAVRGQGEIFRSSYEDLHPSKAPADSTPIGSVEFCSKWLGLLGIEVPEPISYPSSLQTFLGRSIDGSLLYADVPDGWFVKPRTRIKAFTGHLKGQAQEPLPRDISAMEVWCSPPVRFLAEWRYYVMGGVCLGVSRYDDSGIEYPDPPRTLVDAAVAAFTGHPCGYAIDFGLLDDGRYALVEVNDGWALGYYTWGTLDPADYAWLVAMRWREILALGRA